MKLFSKYLSLSLIAIISMSAFCLSAQSKKPVIKYEIKKVIPGSTIKIGNTPRGQGKTFYSNEIINWNWELKGQQAFSFVDVSNPRITYSISKEKVQHILKAKKNTSLASLMSRGNEDFYVVWEGDSIELEVPDQYANDSIYRYELIKDGFSDRKPLFMQDQILIIKWEDICDIKDITDCRIIAVNKENYFIRETIITTTIQIIN